MERERQAAQSVLEERDRAHAEDALLNVNAETFVRCWNACTGRPESIQRSIVVYFQGDIKTSCWVARVFSQFVALIFVCC